jgi:hypothetical protein
MKKTFLSLAMVVTSSLVTIPAAFGQTADGSVLFTPNIDLSTDTQNSFGGYVGGIFLTSYNYYPEVNYLGFYDAGGDGLANSHVVSLWDYSGGNVELASVTIPAGTSAPLVDGYRWVQLSSTVNLTYNNYYYIVAQVGNVDTAGNPVDSWGDLIQNNTPDPADGGPGPVANNGQITWSAQYVFAQTGYEFSRGGVYSSTDDASTFAQTSTSDSIYPAPNLGYNVVPAPEPTALTFAGVGAALLLGFTRKRKS